MSRKLGSLLAGGLAAVVLWACPAPEPTQPPEPAGAHDDFPLIGVHLPVDCVDCHVDGAVEQGVGSGDWVNGISTDCRGCHQDVVDDRFAGNHKDGQSCGNSGCHTLTDGGWTPDGVDNHADFPIVGAHALLDCNDCHVDGAIEQGVGNGAFYGPISKECTGCHEDTRSDLFGANAHFFPTSCGAGGCHQTVHECWREVTGGVCDGTPPQAGHVGDLAKTFPLTAPHDKGCSDCHAGAAADQAGGAERCQDCHSRTGEGLDDTHYPPFASNLERECKACHATEAADGTLQVPTGWSTGAVVHDFQIPHRGNVSCEGCHPPGSQNSAAVSCDACHSDIETVSPLHTNFAGNPYEGCHDDGER